jgi:hypothetical protein
MRKRSKIIIVAILLAVAVPLIGFTVWAYTPPSPMPEALVAMQSDANVNVTTQPWLIFAPTNIQKPVGFIFYPGARVEPRSYAPAAYTLAANGYLTVIVPMPFNLAIFGSGLASDVIGHYPSISLWVVGGHSLGGVMAARFAYDHPSSVKALALWASYPDTSNNLSSANISVISIYGTLDGLSTPDKINASKALLPPNTIYVPIIGGNHAQFGWYGPQSGDNDAAISRENQQSQIVNATLAFFMEINS